MMYYEFTAKVGISGPNSPGKILQKKIATKNLPFEFEKNYHQCLEYNQEQRDFLRKMLGFGFNEFSKNFKSFEFTQIQFQEI